MITPRMATGFVLLVLVAGLSWWAWAGGGQMTTINALSNPPAADSSVVPAKAETHTPKQN